MSRRVDEEFSDEEEIEDLSSPLVVTSYQAAATISNKVLKEVIAQCVVGKSIVEICTLGDKLIEEEVAKTFNKRKGLEKGIAFPTCISVGDCVGHFSPLAGDTRVLAQGDIVKVDLGVHIDGYIAVGAHTVVVGSTPDQPLTGKAADAICAAHFAMEAALRLVRPGNKNSDVTDVIQKIATTYQVTPVSGILSHELKRFVIDGENVIFSKIEPGQRAETFEFQENQVYCLDIVMSTGEGKARQTEERTTIYKRNVDQTYALKIKSSRDFLTEVNKSYPALPFTLRAIKDQKSAKLGLEECLTHNLLSQFPVLHDKKGSQVVQFKTTVLVLPSGNQKIVGSELSLPFVKSDFAIQDQAIKDVLARSMKVQKKKSKSTTTTTTKSDDKMDMS
eukprot:gene7417-9118_t